MEQASLAKDIVWYVPALVDGRQVLVPQLYLSPKTAVISGAAIVGKDVGIQAGSILNSGLMEGTHSIALTSTHGNIINDGGTIRGGDMSLNAQNGSIINRDTINNYLVEGGTSSYLGSQGKILASGTMGIKASDSIITRGGSIQSGSDMAMQAGSIDIGAAQLNAAASSASYGKHEMLAFNGNQTKNYGTMVSAGRNAILQSTRGDLNLAGSTLNVGGDAALSSAGSIGLNAVTDKGLTDVRGHKSGTFNSSSFEEKRAYTNDIGSAVIAGGQIGISAKNDVSLAGAVASKNDVNINAGGNITENALNYSNDTYDYHQTKKFGFFTNEAQLSVQIGQKNVTDKKSTSNSLHTASDIISTEGNVNLNAGKDININGSNVIAGRDINMSGDSVNFNAVQDVFRGDQKHKDSFTGIGLSASGLLANLAKTGFAAANTTDERMEALNAADMASQGLNAGLGKSGILTGAFAHKAATDVDYNLIGITATFTHSSNKSHMTSTTVTDTGSTIKAGERVSVNAVKDINATASSISGNDVIFNAGRDISLDAGYRTSRSKTTISGNREDIGANANVGAHGFAFGARGDASVSWGKTTTYGRTAIDTVVNGTNSVTINNENGRLALNGAQIVNKNPDVKNGDGTITRGTPSNGSITINTGSMSIATPQNVNRYHSNNKTVGMEFSTPLSDYHNFGEGKQQASNESNKENNIDKSLKPNKPDTPYTNVDLFGDIRVIDNDYASTEKEMSGIYAGTGGLNVNVRGDTTLTAGAITSAADASRNQISTGSLQGNSVRNHSIWSGFDIQMKQNLDTTYAIDTVGTVEGGKEVMNIPGNILGNGTGTRISGNSIVHNKHSTTESVIGDNIAVNAGSVNGHFSHDINEANGYMEDKFNPGKINNDFNLQNKATEVMNKYGNMIVDTVVSANKRAENVKNEEDKLDLNHALSEIGLNKKPDESLINGANATAIVGAASSIGGAIMGGGNVGPTAAGAAGGLAGNIIYNHFFPDGPFGKDDNRLNPNSPNYHQDTKIINKEKNVHIDTSSNSQYKKQTQNTNNIKYDDTTDINKIASGMIHTGIIGGASAITGIMGGSDNLNGTNTAIDAITGGLTGLAQSAPKVEKGKNKGKKPVDKAGSKPKAEQADGNPERTEKKGDTK